VPNRLQLAEVAALGGEGTRDRAKRSNSSFLTD
jgi:hypothetical protein